jgi:pimeloyl-ACP methyl ester carboxylesterase
VADRLHAAGNDVVSPDLPYDDPSTTYAERVRPALHALDGVEGPVIVVGHSLGAGYAPLVADAIDDAALIYVCPAPVGPFADAGAPMPSTQEGFEFPPNRPDGTSVWDTDAALTAMYPRLSPETAQIVAACLKPGSSPADSYPLSAQPAVPTTIVFARYDEFFNPEWSRWIAREVAHVEPIAVETGHFPMVEAPDALASLLLGA